MAKQDFDYLAFLKSKHFDKGFFLKLGAVV